MIYKIDAKNKILGKIAVEAANILRGKGKSQYVPYQDCGDPVEIINTDRVKVTGKKLKQKIYWRHSGYPGGIKARTLEEQMARDSRQVLQRAVYGMLPKNKLRDKVIRKLKLYKTDKLI